MFSFLRQMRWKPLLIVTAVGLPVAAFVAPFTPQYHPVAERLEQRFLETEGRARWQVEARAEAARREEARRREEAARLEAQRREAAERAAAERRRQEEELRQAQAEQARREAEDRARGTLREQTAQEYQHKTREYMAIIRQNTPSINTMLNSARALGSRLSASAQNPAFYQQNGITIEEAATRRPCTDPADFADMFDRDKRTKRNMLACLVHYSTDAESARDREFERNLVSMIFSRFEYGNGTQLYPIHWILTYAWTAYYTKFGQLNHRVPPLISGERMNRALLNGFVADGFVRILFDSLSMEERLYIRDTTHPQLLRLSQIATELYDVCGRGDYVRCGSVP